MRLRRGEFIAAVLFSFVPMLQASELADNESRFENCAHFVRQLTLEDVRHITNSESSMRREELNQRANELILLNERSPEDFGKGGLKEETVKMFAYWFYHDEKAKKRWLSDPQFLESSLFDEVLITFINYKSERIKAGELEETEVHEFIRELFRLRVAGASDTKALLAYFLDRSILELSEASKKRVISGPEHLSRSIELTSELLEFRNDQVSAWRMNEAQMKAFLKGDGTYSSFLESWLQASWGQLSSFAFYIETFVSGEFGMGFEIAQEILDDWSTHLDYVAQASQQLLDQSLNDRDRQFLSSALSSYSKLRSSSEYRLFSSVSKNFAQKEQPFIGDKLNDILSVTDIRDLPALQDEQPAFAGPFQNLQSFEDEVQAYQLELTPKLSLETQSRLLHYSQSLESRVNATESEKVLKLFFKFVRDQHALALRLQEALDQEDLKPINAGIFSRRLKRLFELREYTKKILKRNSSWWDLNPKIYEKTQKLLNSWPQDPIAFLLAEQPTQYNLEKSLHLIEAFQKRGLDFKRIPIEQLEHLGKLSPKALGLALRKKWSAQQIKSRQTGP